jgi:hypothetical protein
MGQYDDSQVLHMTCSSLPLEDMLLFLLITPLLLSYLDFLIHTMALMLTAREQEFFARSCATIVIIDVPKVKEQSIKDNSKG